MVTADWNASVARVATGRDVTRSPAGVGVVVTSSSVITCAHVVNLALGRDKYETEAPPAETEVLIQLPLVAGGEQAVSCAVSTWIPPSRGLAGTGDIAVLVTTHLPECAEPARMIEADASVNNERVMVFGYPGDPPRKQLGALASCLVRGMVGSGLIQLDSDPGSALRPQPGFSGSPVVLTRNGTDYVLGLLAIASRDTGARDAYLIPTTLIRRAWHDLPVDSPVAAAVLPAHGDAATVGTKQPVTRPHRTTLSSEDQYELLALLRNSLTQLNVRDIAAYYGPRGRNPRANYQERLPAAGLDRQISALLEDAVQTSSGAVLLEAVTMTRPDLADRLPSPSIER
jgi:Trypsin-like peptidase domain